MTEDDLRRLNSQVARVHRMRAEYVRLRAFSERRKLVIEIVALEEELRREFGLALNQWDHLDPRGPSAA